MRRRLFNVLAAVSVILFVAIFAFWVRSIWVRDTFVISRATSSPPTRRLVTLSSTHGRLWLTLGRSTWVNIVLDPADVQSIITWQSKVMPPPQFYWMHFRISAHDVLLEYPYALPGGGTRQLISPSATQPAARYEAIWFGMPHWVLILLSSIPSVSWLLRFRRQRYRVRLGLCENCGYNLTGNVSGTCPECGTGT